MKYDNTTNKNDLPLRKYSSNKIEEIKTAAAFGSMTFDQFKREYDVQCVRETHQGFYIVLSIDNGGNAFVFFNEDRKLISVLAGNGYLSKEDFVNQVLEQKTESKVLEMDPNAILLPVSAAEVTAHIVQEGICIVKYSRFSEGKIIADPSVSSVEFIENENIPTNEDPLIRDEIPYVLEIDKSIAGN